MGFCLCTLAEYTGYAVAGFFALTFLQFLYKHFLRPGVNLKKFGDWAVITGATDGIGKAIAFEVARKGLNVLLISRTQSKLDATAAEIEGKYPKVQTKTLSIDYSKFDEADQRKVQKAVADLKVAVLVNNVGVGYTHPDTYNLWDISNVDFMTRMNISSVALMTKLLLPGMEQEGKGLIVNISSGSGALGGCPMLTHYAASKAYVIEFSRGLAYEYANSKHDIRVQAQIPMYVQTKLAGFNMKKKLRPQLDTPSAKVYAKQAVKQFGQDIVISPYWFHALFIYITNMLPKSITTGQTMKIHKKVKKKYLKKHKQQ